MNKIQLHHTAFHNSLREKFGFFMRACENVFSKDKLLIPADDKRNTREDKARLANDAAKVLRFLRKEK